MRRRVLATTKILAVALAFPACTKTETAPKPQETITQAADTPAATAPPVDSKDPKLLALREDLVGTDRAKVDKSKFRPLCDKDGYPLVGNLARKSPNYDVAELCAEIRKTEGH